MKFGIKKLFLIVVLSNLVCQLQAQTIKPDSQGSSAQSQAIPYGNNPQAGHYFDVGDARLYYEVYGKGKPIVMLHGGVYGYISEFEPFINRLSESYQVICIATRGSW